MSASPEAEASRGDHDILFGPMERMIMTEISKLKKENKQLRALLSDAVDLLKQSKKLLKQPKNKTAEKKPKKKR